MFSLVSLSIGFDTKSTGGRSFVFVLSFLVAAWNLFLECLLSIHDCAELIFLHREARDALW
jgi:hypothetical protein